MSKHSDILTAVDIGTTKVCVMISQINEHGGLDILGLGKSNFSALQQGAVNDIAKTVNATKKAIEEAVQTAGVDIGEVYIATSAAGINGQNIENQLTLEDHNSEVKQEDINQLLENARQAEQAKPEQSGRNIIHVLPYSYDLDTQTNIKNPLYMSGYQLKAKAFMVSVPGTPYKNLKTCCKQCGLQTDNIVLSSYASGLSVLSEEEKELGVVLLDIGGGTTDLSIWKDGCLRYISVIPDAGSNMTSDISMVFKTSMSEAESIKTNYGVLQEQMVPRDVMIQVPGIGGRENQEQSAHLVWEIMDARAREVIENICQEIKNSGFLPEELPAGIVLTGGASMTKGLKEMMQGATMLAPRIGYPILNSEEGVTIGGIFDDNNNDPSYATALGLLLYGLAKRSEGDNDYIMTGSSEGIFSKLANIFKDMFSE